MARKIWKPKRAYTRRVKGKVKKVGGHRQRYLRRMMKFSKGIELIAPTLISIGQAKKEAKQAERLGRMRGYEHYITGLREEDKISPLEYRKRLARLEIDRSKEMGRGASTAALREGAKELGKFQRERTLIGESVKGRKQLASQRHKLALKEMGAETFGSVFAAKGREEAKTEGFKERFEFKKQNQPLKPEGKVKDVEFTDDEIYF